MNKTNNSEMAVYGKRIREVRENILKKTQTEFAAMIGSKQTLVSRLERGQSCNSKTLFFIVKILNDLGFPGEMIFSNDFEVSKFTKKEDTERKKDLIIKLINNI